MTLRSVHLTHQYARLLGKNKHVQNILTMVGAKVPTRSYSTLQKRMKHWLSSNSKSGLGMRDKAIINFKQSCG